MDLKIKSWCLFLNLQVGVMFASAGFITMAINMMIVNMKVTSTDNRWTFNTGIYIYAVLLMITWIIAFMGAYLQESNLVLGAMILWTIFTVSWFIAGFLSSFSETFGSMLCMDKRCAVSMWMCPNRLYNAFYEKLDYFYHVPHDPANDIPIRDPFAYFDFSDEDEIEGLSLQTKVSTAFQRERLETKIILAAVLFASSSITTMFILLSSWILLYSYYKELNCLALFLQCNKICQNERTIVNAV